MNQLIQKYMKNSGTNVSPIVRINVQSLQPDQNYENRDVAIQMEPNNAHEDLSSNLTESKIGAAPNYLLFYSDFMYYIGVSLKKWRSTTLSLSMNRLSKIRFWVISFLAILQTLKNLKSFGMGHLRKGNLFHYVDLGYYCVHFILLIYFLKLITSTNSLVDLVSSTACAKTLSRKTNKVGFIVASIAVLSFVMSLFRGTIGYLSFEGWTISNVILSNSWQMAKGIYIWNKGNTSEVISDLISAYASTVTPTTFIFGVAEILMDCCHWIYDAAAKDLVLFAGLTTHQLLTNFEFECKRKPNLDSAEIKNEEKIMWENYTELQTISGIMRECLGGILNLIHIDNFLVALSFLVEFLEEGAVDHVTFILFLNVLRMMMTYYCAAIGTKKNLQFRKWIRENYKPDDETDIGSSTINISMVLDELSTNPIGLGSDFVFVDQAFVWQFVTSLASCFVILAEFKEKD